MTGPNTLTTTQVSQQPATPNQAAALPAAAGANGGGPGHAPGSTPATNPVDAGAGAGRSSPSPAPASAGSTPPPAPPAAMPQAQADDFDRRFQAIARREAELMRAQEQGAEKDRELSDLRADRELWKSDWYKAAKKYGGNLKDFSLREMNEGAPGPEERIIQLEQRIETLLGDLEKKDTQDREFHEGQVVRDYAQEVGHYIGQETYSPVGQFMELSKVLFGTEPNLEVELAPYLRGLREQRQGIPAPAKAAEIMLGSAKEKIEALKGLKWLRELFVPAATQAPASAGTQVPAPVSTPQEGTWNDRPQLPGRRSAPGPTMSGSDESAGRPPNPQNLNHEQRLRLMAQRLDEVSAAKGKPVTPPQA